MKRDLPDYMTRALRTGERTWKSKGYSRNHLVFSISLSMYQHGWSCEEFIAEILDPKNLAGEKYQDMYEEKARKKLNYDWDRTVAFVNDNPPMMGRDIVEKRLGNAIEQVSTAPWGGKTGSTDRHVLLTVLMLAHEVGTYTPAFSTRTLAMVANKRQETIAKSLGRLRESGLLSVLTPSTCRKSTVYEVKLDTLESGSLNPLPGLVFSDPVSSVQMVLGNDLFARGCLGEAAGRLWTQLQGDRAYTVTEMSKHLGLSSNSCRVAVKRLESVGLADLQSGRPARYTMVYPSDEDTACLEMLLMELETWAQPYGEGDGFLDYSGHQGRSERRTELYERQQAARKIRFSTFYDKPTGEFVDPETGEALSLPA